MITTKEGDIKKRGNNVWEIGFCITNKSYRPTLSKVHISVANPNACWTQYDNCLSECDRKNQIEKRKKICDKLLK